jgi:imidazoleglycerol-phosphate dehydratase
MTARARAKPAGIRVRRRTRETVVSVEIDPARSGNPEVELADRMLGHAIESFAAWADLPLRIRASGDLDHHTTEDTALVLGRALRRWVGERPLARVGEAVVPMDDALVQVVLDLADRPYAALDPSLDGDTEHFLRSLAHEAGWTIHVRVLAGTNPHHRTEATFKALGIAWARATVPRVRTASRKGPPRWSERTW